MMNRTYDEWKSLGFHVRKGEKASGRDSRSGLAVFSPEQVEDSNNQGDYEYEQEADDFFGTVYEFDRIGDRD
jgi:hypothetical protein